MAKKSKKVTKKTSKKVAKKTAPKAKKKGSKKTTQRTSKKSSAATSPMLKAGNKAPSFTLQDQHGKTISLSDFAGQPVVLYFYPKDMTPGCTQEACDFRDSLSQLNSLKAVVLGVSKDSVDLHKRFAEKYGLNFSLLADVDGKACEAYGVWQEKSLYGRKFMGIVRATFIIGPDQTIKKVYPKVKVQGHVDEIIEDLKNL
jgi:peroxiredoxin Q/BCP